MKKAQKNGWVRLIKTNELKKVLSVSAKKLRLCNSNNGRDIVSGIIDASIDDVIVIG